MATYEKGSECLSKSSGCQSSEGYSDAYMEKYTSTGLKKLMVKSTGPAESTKVV
jgi:hypothetical protein